MRIALALAVPCPGGDPIGDIAFLMKPVEQMNAKGI